MRLRMYQYVQKDGWIGRESVAVGTMKFHDQVNNESDS